MWLLGLATGYELMPVNMILSLEQVLRHAIQASLRVNFLLLSVLPHTLHTLQHPLDTVASSGWRWIDGSCRGRGQTGVVGVEERRSCERRSCERRGSCALELWSTPEALEHTRGQSPCPCHEA